jgi:hypothetical protein
VRHSMDLLTLHFARHALAAQAQSNPALLPALGAVDAEIATGLASAPADTDHGALAAALCGVARSGHWRTVEEEFRAEHPTCEACDGAIDLQIHHRMDFHTAILLGRPDLELDPRNLITLCMGPELQHHLLLGHLDDYRSYNPAVANDVAAYATMSSERIRSSPNWQAERDARAKPWDEWSPALKTSERAKLDTELPPDPVLLARFGLTVRPYTG